MIDPFLKKMMGPFTNNEAIHTKRIDRQCKTWNFQIDF